MKRFLSLLLAALMLLACGSALAETVEYKELGISIDFSGIEAKAANCPFLENYGILNQEPYVACMEIVFADLPRNVIETMDSIIKNTQDEAEYNDYYNLVRAFSITIGQRLSSGKRTRFTGSYPQVRESPKHKMRFFSIYSPFIVSIYFNNYKGFIHCIQSRRCKE